MSLDQLRSLWEEKRDNMPDRKFPISVFHKTDGNRRYAQKHGISKAEGHKAGADNVETLVRFYRKHLPDIVKEMSFWYMSKDNVKGRTPDEARALYQLLTDRKSKLISLAHESGAAVVPFGELDILPQMAQDHLLEIEEATQGNKDCKIGLAAGYSRTPHIVRTILEQSEKSTRLSSVLSLFGLAVKASARGSNIDNRIQEALLKMHKGLSLPHLYLMAGASHGVRTSDGFYDPNSTHLYPTDKLWPEVDGDLAVKAIIDMLLHSKITRGT